MDCDALLTDENLIESTSARQANIATVEDLQEPLLLPIMSDVEMLQTVLL